MTTEKRNLIWSAPLFDLPDELVAELERHRASRDGGAVDPIEKEFDCFLLDPGLGPRVYLCRTGQILWDDDGWEIEPSVGKAYASIAVGARKTGVRGLLELLPEKPPDAQICQRCEGSGWERLPGTAAHGTGEPVSFACINCGASGWLSDSVDLSGKTL